MTMPRMPLVRLFLLLALFLAGGPSADLPQAGRGPALVAGPAHPAPHAPGPRGDDLTETDEAGTQDSTSFREISTIIDNAPPRRAVDLVIVGDGYTIEDVQPGAIFELHARQFINCFFREQPFEGNKQLFNVYLVRAVSRARGADQNHNEDLRDTIFDSAYGAYGIDRLLVIRRPQKLRELVRLAPEQDIVIVLVNDTRYGGSGYQLPAGSRTIPAPIYAAGNSSGIRIAFHELGHSLANLADEYVDESIAGHYSLAYLPEKPNVDVTTNLAEIKWKTFFTQDPNAKGTVGAIEGGYYRSHGIWRPEANCLMRSLEYRFCNVCRKEITRALYRIAGKKFDEAEYHRKNRIAPKEDAIKP